jgi:SAM-dependent methyltransferase
VPRDLAAPAAPVTETAARRPGEHAHLARLSSFFDRFAADEERWRRRNRTYHRLLESICRFLIPPNARVLELGSGGGALLAALEPSRGVGVDVSGEMVALARARHPELEFVQGAAEHVVREETFDYVVLSDLVPFAYDLQAVLKNVAAMTDEHSRVVIHSYSQFWRPVIRLAELLRLKQSKPIRNWVTPDDCRNLLDLSGFETISVTRRILFPKKIPLLTTFLNGVVAHVWPLSHLCLTYWVLARPRPGPERRDLGVSVVVPCRNEEGTVPEIVARIPELGTGTEIVFVEGGSTDGTRQAIEREIAAHPEREISLYTQTGNGKADAVRVGFERARHEVLMILDGDLTVAPEDLPKFYAAVRDGRADFVNGSRLVYDLEPEAMQFLNILGNKFFSGIFSFLIDQHVKDTLCGTKVLRRSDYDRIVRGRSYFGDFDPFGDFDLLLGSARLGLKIVDVPVRYAARTYGSTNISRFRHGWQLVRMSVVGFVKLKVEPVRV